ncbi:MAG: hypothetical protein K8R67_14525 [Desulfobacteraceae bacterium]|nr:hypothetical protein [Desulfobacteraceae bacterium]
MIKPIFFPFTHIQDSDIKVISAFFKSIFFFPASEPAEFEESVKNMADKDLLLPIYAEKKDFEPVLHKVDEYRKWGELNKENKGNLKVFLQEKPYLTNDTGVPHIRAGIERVPEESGDLPSEENSLFKSLMLLRLAKIYDLEKDNLNNQFNDIKKNEEKLFSAIQGLDQKSDRNLGQNRENLFLNRSVEDLGEYMTSRRLSAWVDFFNRRKPFSSFDSPLLFVTTSAAVMEYLISISKNIIKSLDIDKLKVHEKKCENMKQWVKTFNKYVEDLVVSGQQPVNAPAERDDNCTLEVQIKLYLLQGDVISSFFQGVGQSIPVCLISV